MPVFIIIIVLLLISGGVYIYNYEKAEAPVVNEENIKVNDTEIVGNKENLVSFSVKAGDSVSGVLSLTGTIQNAYFFEGNIIIKLLDENQNVLKSGFGMATTEWTTSGPVSFNSSIDSTGLSGPGFILIQNDDPSDGEGWPDKKILIPVIFNNINEKIMSINLYFPNNILNPESFDCSLVYPVTRIIPYTKAVASATLDELIKGPTKEEEKNGYFGIIPEGTKVNSIKIVDGVLFVDFSKEAESGGGSCGQAAKVSSITETLSQFPTVKSIKISINGNSDSSEIFQP